MNPIRELEGKDFKGGDSFNELQMRNLVLGENGSGKTRLLQMIAFAVTGRTELGGTNDASMQLMGPLGGSVRAKTAKGFGWTRHLIRDARENKVSSKLEVAGVGRIAVKEAEALIAENVGTFAPMFNLGEFTSLAPDKKRRAVLDLCSKARGEDVDAKAVLRRAMLEVLRLSLGAATVDKHLSTRRGQTGAPEGSQEELEAMLRELSGDLPKAFREATHCNMGAIHSELKGDIASSLMAAIDRADKGKVAARQAKDQAHAAARHLAEERARLQVSAKSAEALQEEYNDLAAQKEDLSGQLKLQEGKSGARDTLSERISRLTTSVANIETQIKQVTNAPLEGGTADVARLADEAAALEAQHPAPNRAALAELAGLHREANDAAAQTSSTVTKAILLLDRWTGECETLRAQIKAAQESNAGRLVAIVEGDAGTRIAGLVAGVPEAAAAWQTIVACANGLRDQGVGPLKLKLASAEAAAESAATAKQTAETNAAAAQTLLQGAAGRLAEQQAAYEQQRIAHEKALNEAHAKKLAAQRIENAINSRAVQLKQLDSQLAQERSDLLAAERELNALDSQGGHVPAEDLRAQYERTVNSMAEIDTALQRKRQFAVLENKLTDCTAQAEAEATNYESWDCLGRALRAIREEMMVELVKPLLSRIDRFLSVAMPEHRAYCELANERGTAIFELGWTVGGHHRVSLPAMSGGESALFGAALIYALVGLADPPCRMIGLEAAELDRVHLARLMQALSSIDDMDLIILATCHPVNVETAEQGGWNVILPQVVRRQTEGEAITEQLVETVK